MNYKLVKYSFDTEFFTPITTVKDKNEAKQLIQKSIEEGGLDWQAGFSFKTRKSPDVFFFMEAAKWEDLINSRDKYTDKGFGKWIAKY